MHHVAHAVHIDDHARADDFFPCLSLPHAGPMQLRKSPIENTERKCDSLAMLYSHVTVLALKCLIGKLKTFGGSK